MYTEGIEDVGMEKVVRRTPARTGNDCTPQAIAVKLAQLGGGVQGTSQCHQLKDLNRL